MGEDEGVKKYTLLELENSLNEQQKRFCESRLFNNKVQSYMIAYPNCKYKSASASASKLLEDTRIEQYTDYLKKDIENITGVSKIRNISELAKIAFSSIAHLHNTWIELKEFDALTNDQKAAIESTETKHETKQIFNIESNKREEVNVNYIKVKLYPKIAAIQEINKMMGYNEPDKVEHSGEIKGLTLKWGDNEIEV